MHGPPHRRIAAAGAQLQLLIATRHTGQKWPAEVAFENDEKGVVALFLVSENGGCVVLSEDKLATIKEILVAYDSMDGPEPQMLTLCN
eukprot:SAG31_NODE_3126_length_4646_cov_6.852210_7_plen_88_part_00